MTNKLCGAFITGFVQADGCFHVSRSKSSVLVRGIRLVPVFSITQYKTENSTLLKSIREFYNAGSISYGKRDNCDLYTVKGYKLAQSVIIPHFQKFPLEMPKHKSFVTYKYIVENRKSLKDDSFWDSANMCISQMNAITPEKPHLEVLPKGMQKPLHPAYISGLVQGDGGFCIFFRENKKNTNFKIGYSFTLGCNHALPILKKVQNYFKCGNIHAIKNSYYRYTVADLHCLEKIIIPHFKSYPLWDDKKEVFFNFCSVISKISENKKHRRSLPLLLKQEIVQASYKINMEGKRRRSLQRVEKVK